MRRDPYNNELLKGMYYKHGSYWLVRRNKWHRLGSAYNNALRGYAGLSETAGGMPKLITQAYTDYALRVKSGELKASSLIAYETVKGKLLEVFAKMDPGEVTPAHIKQVMRHCWGGKPVTANKALSVLRSVFDLGMDMGLCDFNPARQIKGGKVSKRTRRLTDGEFKKIRSQAKGQLPLVMDVLYYTGQRIGDVLAIKQADISNGILKIRQIKTGKEIDIEIGPQLEKAIAGARKGPVTGLWLFSRHGKPLPYPTIRSAYDAACALAGVEGTTLHDIRAKAITDLTLKGHDAQALAGHTDAKMTERYIRERNVVRVKSLDSLL